MMKRINYMLIIIIMLEMIPLSAFANNYYDCFAFVGHSTKCSHTWSKWSTKKKPTIKKRGVKKRHCVKCNKYQFKYTKKLKPFIKMRKKKTIKKGKRARLKVKMARGDKVKKWRTSNKKIVTVDKRGRIKARRKGKAWITVKLKSGKKAKCRVKVIKGKRHRYNKKRKHKYTGKVYWTPHGKVWHVTRHCPTLSRSRVICSGTIKQSHKPRCCKVCG